MINRDPRSGARQWIVYLTLTVCYLGCPAIVVADQNDWAEGVSTQDGASRDYYNRAAVLPWSRFMGDWCDKNDQPHGDVAFAVAKIDDTDRARFVVWDVQELVTHWQSGRHQNLGFFLRTIQSRGKVCFQSREEAIDPSHRPCLTIESSEGTSTLFAIADTHLDRSTYRSLGQSSEIVVQSDNNHALIRFDLSSIPADKTILSATLRLWTTRQYGDTKVAVFRCQQGESVVDGAPTKGIADDYVFDREIATHPDVLLAADFQSQNWPDAWANAKDDPLSHAVESDPQRKFESLRGKALRVKIAQGANFALGMSYPVQNQIKSEPNEIYFRYYLRLADDWNQTLQGGKMPGISGTYGIAGWGGRKSNGDNGWSARGLFKQTIPENNPLGGRTPIGTYCYHADMPGNYGENWVWSRGYRGFLEKNRWYCVEQYLRNNNPGEKDGVIRAWIDGRLAFEKTSIRFRNLEKLQIEKIWMNVYHGGTKPSPHDQHLYIDHVVIAKSYIGPMGNRDANE